MTDNPNYNTLPKLTYFAPEIAGPGVQMCELKLDPFGDPLAPFKASRDTVEPNCITPIDSHEVREIWFIAKGKGELIYDNRSLRIRSGDVVYFEPNKTHQLRNDGEDMIVFYSIWWGS